MNTIMQMIQTMLNQALSSLQTQQSNFLKQSQTAQNQAISDFQTQQAELQSLLESMPTNTPNSIEQLLAQLAQQQKQINGLERSMTAQSELIKNLIEQLTEQNKQLITYTKL